MHPSLSTRLVMTPKIIAEAYARGENVTELMRVNSGRDQNTEDIIEAAYDLQSGSYIDALKQPDFLEYKIKYGAAIASEILDLVAPLSILEPGIGEGTTLTFVLDAFEDKPKHIHGFDISWSRVAHCRRWLVERGYPSCFLSRASLLNMPYQSNSFDVVYTSHAIEPNGGNEEAILRELYRVTSKYLLLLEPSYEFASPEAQSRMNRLGYCQDLVKLAGRNGMHVVKHELFPLVANALNPTAITVIEKNTSMSAAEPRLVCPMYQTSLEVFDGVFYSEDSMRAYPSLKNVPCLATEDAVTASAYRKF